MIPVQACVPATLADLLRDQPLSPAKVAFAWQAAVGPAMARATEAALDAGGRLSVSASDRHWKREVEAARPLILARMGALLGAGTVKALLVRAPATGGSRGSGRRGGPARRGVAPTDPLPEE